MITFIMILRTINANRWYVNYHRVMVLNAVVNTSACCASDLGSDLASIICCGLSERVES